MIGILGGTFDPPHLAHAVLADEASHQLELDKTLWVVTAQPPHKPDRPISAIEHRLAMVELVTANNARFELSRADLDREPPHYAVGTIKWLQDRYDGEKFAYIMGSDSLRDLPSWHDPEGFVEACDLIAVMQRKDAHADLGALEQRFPGLRDKLSFLEIPLLEISGHAIRQRIRDGRPFRYFLLSEVARYVEVNQLYR